MIPYKRQISSKSELLRKCIKHGSLKVIFENKRSDFKHFITLCKKSVRWIKFHNYHLTPTALSHVTLITNLWNRKKMNRCKNATEAQLVNRVTDRNNTNPISNLEEGGDLERNWKTITNWKKGEGWI